MNEKPPSPGASREGTFLPVPAGDLGDSQLALPAYLDQCHRDKTGGTMRAPSKNEDEVLENLLNVEKECKIEGERC